MPKFKREPGKTGEPRWWDFSNPETPFEVMSHALYSYFAGHIERSDAELCRKYADTALKAHSNRVAQSADVKRALLRLAEVQPAEDPHPHPHQHPHPHSHSHGDQVSFSEKVPDDSAKVQ